MKVKVNIINICCILMSEAVIVPNLMMVTLIVSEKSLVSDTQTQTCTDLGSSILNLFSKQRCVAAESL